MSTKTGIVQVAGLFLTERLNSAIRFVYGVAMILWISAVILRVGFLHAGAHAEIHGHGSQPTVDSDWSELIASMDKMHMAMGAVKRSGNADVDFVRLMIPHHQAAIDMARTQLLYGKDTQMRRLAQEIIADQQ